MSMTDPIADMLARIRNALGARHVEVNIPGSNQKRRIAAILKEEGFIKDYSWEENEGRGVLRIALKFVHDQPAIEGLQRVSRPGRRRYARYEKIPKIRNGLGIMIVSTSKGIMTDRAARRERVGGELMCSVW
jgi:small subunit ribosomal protein S8